MFTRENLEHVAKIARISLTDEEFNELLPQFEEILQLLSRVRSLPLGESSEITTTDNESEFRPDAVVAFPDPDAIVSEFPRREGRNAKVPPNL